MFPDSQKLSLVVKNIKQITKKTSMYYDCGQTSGLTEQNRVLLGPITGVNLIQSGINNTICDL